MGVWASAIEEPARWLIGDRSGASYLVARWVFLRGLGVVYLVAFVSLAGQITGLIGSRGILPAADLLQTVRAYVPGTEHWHLVPSLLWLDASDAALRSCCLLGCTTALLVIANVAPRVTLGLSWVVYLSLVAVGQDFLSFQWDALLLEAGLLSLFLAPGHLWARPAAGEGARVSPLALLLLWWLLFRLTVGSGVVKLTWGDPTWRTFTALDYHYWTQPLPTWTAWYVSHMPAWFQRMSVVATFLLELGTPLLIFGPRRTRWVACAGVVGLQAMIGATGNYTFFNLLTIALAALLLDDVRWSVLLPHRVVARLKRAEAPRGARASPWMSLVGLFLLAASTARFATSLVPRRNSSAVDRALAWTAPFRSLNAYGLFRVMTTTRREIMVEGSDDGQVWRAYGFKYKPGEVRRRPRFIEPFQPRLDWQMWFAALGRYEDTPWVAAFLTRLLQGSPPVLHLLAENPFPDRPPRYVRALLYDYRFTTPAERKTTGAWWTRRLLGPYSPVISLRP